MRSIGATRSGAQRDGISRRRFATALGGPVVVALAALLLALVAGGVPRASADAPLPASLPPGYSMERDGNARWIYPTSAEAEVAALKHVARSAWSRLGRELGVAPARDVDIRIGLDPAQMQALAPAGVPLPGYASGVALPEAGVIMLTFAAPGSWMRPDMERVLVHELSHVALYRAAGGHEVPRWFSEGRGDSPIRRALDRARALALGGQRARRPDRVARAVGAFSRDARVKSTWRMRRLRTSSATCSKATPGRARFRALVSALRAGQPFEQALANGVPGLARSARATVARATRAAASAICPRSSAV